MKVELEVIASTSIKRRKPWPRIFWVGTKQQSLLLVDKQRVSVLYIPTGKTKHKIPQLSGVVTSAACVNATPGGGNLLGVLENGDVFVWNKDQDKLQTICGLATILDGVTLSHGSCQVFASDDCSKVLVAVQCTQLFLWQRDTRHTYPEGKDHTLVGRWSRMAAPEGMALPAYDSQEACLHAIFVSSSLLGDCCDISMVFNSGDNMTICSVLIRFEPPDPAADSSYPSIQQQWKCLQYPLRNISLGCEAINVRGAYVPRYSRDASILAVAVNQKSPADTSMLFVSPITDMLLLSTMRGCGVRDPETKRGKAYWVKDMAWLCDSLFLACILSNGSAALLSRLGEPVAIVTHGCSVDMGPAYFLPLHPLITVQGEEAQQKLLNREFEPSSAEDGEPLQQLFSVSSHPALPILVFSDGFMVTFAQLPGDLSTFVFMRSLVLESSKHLKQVGESQNLDLTVANAYNLPEERVKSSPRRQKTQSDGKKHFSFEALDGSLNETVDSEVNMVLGHDATSSAKFGGIENMSSGKIVFGEPDLLQTVLDAADLREGESSLMKSVVSAKHAMLQVWKLAASSSEPWTANMDSVVCHLVDNVVKLFSVILDCPPVSEALEQQQQSRPTPAVQTASLYQVISLYRHMLEVAQFDALRQHLAPSVLHLAHVTMTTVLGSRALQTTDPRLKTLSGCFTLLKFTEKTLNNLYIWLPKSVHTGGRAAHRALGEVFEPLPSSLGGGKGKGSEASSDSKHDGGLSFDTSQLMAKRLAASWKTLYKAVLSYQQGAPSELNSQHAQQLLSLIQQSLQAINASVPHSTNVPISKGDKLSLDGKHTLAMNAWRDQLRRFQETGNDAHAGKLLHSLLYTHLLKMDLLSAVELIDSLVVQANVQSAIETHPLTKTPPIQPSFMTFVTNTLKSQAFHEPDMVPCIRDRAIRQVVQTLARFMAAYFSNQTVYIFPPHNPQPLPAIHFQANILNNRILPKYHEEISAKVRQQKLSSIWTVERALEYLLLSGLVCEAAWFAHQMGNWKTAFQLATACTLHRVIAPRLYNKPKKPLQLPEDLTPVEILHSKLSQLVGPTPSPSSPEGGVLIDERTDMAQLSATLEDIMLAGVMGQVEVTPQLLTLLVSRLKATMKRFHPLVPSEFYLPAPPLYCPQPTANTKGGMAAAVQEEVSLRQQASSIVQVILAVMNSAHVSVPAMTWYVHKLAAAQPKAVQFKTNMEGPCQNIPGVLLEQLGTRSEFEKVTGDLSIHSVLASFRDLCSLLWMMHARDSLSQSLRKREKFLGQLGYNNYEKSQWEGERQSEWLSLCWSCLRWAAHLLSFTHFLPDEGSVHKVLVSMLLELAPSTDVADLMAEFFHDTHNAHPELQERLDKVMSDWQSIIVKPEEDGRSVRNSQESFDGRKSVTFHGASPRGESLSVYFLKQQQVAKKVLKKKVRCFGHYEEYVFARGVEPPKKLYVGARPFETKISFFDFLDMFCSVSFSKVLDRMTTKDRVSTLPLINSLCGDLVHQEMNYFVENVAAQAHKGRGLLILAGSVDHYASQDDLTSDSRRESRSGGRATGLYRGKSFMEQTLERYHAAVTKGKGEASSDVDPNSPRQNWQLTVNFGKKYTRLQQLLEWLEVWSNKHHKFGLGRHESVLALKPSMKLQIPAQLIVLSLWLLENKYSSTARQSPRFSDTERGRQGLRGGNTLRTSSMSPSDVKRGGNKRVSPARGRGHSRSSSGSPQRQVIGEVMLEAQQAGLARSLPLSSLRDEEEIRTAYEQVLEGPDDSSSVVVSSLASDELPEELQRTNNALRSGSPSRGENSALNHTLYMDRSQSPYERPQNPSPDPRSSTPTPRGRSPEQRSAGTSPIRSPPVPSPRLHRGQAMMRDREEDEMIPSGEGGLAHMLQQVIRKEMRRIVQIQQHSLSAMMGAIDGSDLPDPDPNLDPAAFRGQRSRQPQSVRHALSELHNLQQQQQTPTYAGRSSPAHRATIEEEVLVSRSAGPLHMSHLGSASSRSRSEDQENRPPGFPQFLRIPAEREEDGFRLPIIPQQAWGAQPPQGTQGGAPPPLPLLRLSGGPPQPGVYASPQYPGGMGSGSALPAARFLPPSQPPPSYQQAAQELRPLSFQHVPPQAPAAEQEKPSSGEGLIGIPLLRLPSAGFPQTSQEPLFGRLVPPEYLGAHVKQQEMQEAAKQRHLQGFHQQLAEQRAEAEAKMDREREEMAKRAAAESQRQQRAKQGREERQERDSSRSEEAVAAPRVTVKSRGKKTKTPTPPHSTETEEDLEATVHSDRETQQPLSPHSQTLEPDDSTIHDGYAIQPGVFEGYQHLEQELEAETDSNARFQYKMAQAMRRQLEKEKERWLQHRKVDFATNTRDYTDASVDVQRSFESIRTAEAATAITRDAGVDPIHEAIAEYNRTRQGLAVPPDVFLGLRFNEGQEDGQTGKSGGRAFLNVVDVHASSVLRDIPERDEAREEADAEVKPASYLTRDTSPHRMGELEMSLRAQLEPEQQRRHDAVTVSLFERRAAIGDRASVALLPRDSGRDSKTALVQRLRAMNDQMTVMDEMSRNIENEFHNSKMLLQTLQSMNDSFQPGQAPDVHQEVEMDPTRLSAEGLTPKQSGGSPAHSARMSARSARSGRSTRSARTPSPLLHSRKSDGSPRHEVSRGSNLSGISDISDIIGEVLAEGGVDLVAAGITQEEADAYAAHARDKHHPRSPLSSYQELKTMVAEREEEKMESQSPEVHRQQIKQWMTEKFAERQNEYQQHRRNLQEREVRPYRPASEVPMGTRGLRNWESEREQRRQALENENMKRRIADAEYLIGSAITEAVETRRGLSRSRSPSPRSRSASTSPVRSRGHSKSSRGPSVPSVSPRRRDARPSPERGARVGERQQVTSGTAMDQTFSIAAPPKGILKATQPMADVRRSQPILVQPAPETRAPAAISSEFEVTGESSADLRDYMSAMMDMDSSEEIKAAPPRRESRPRGSKGEESARRAYAPLPQPGTPRRVKTYTERLQELKPKQRYASPIIPRQHIVDSASTMRSARSAPASQRRPSGPPHKPVTYVEQLKNINKAATMRTQQGRRSARTAPAKTRMPARPASHRPKTYTEQLQELNAPYKKTFRSAARAPSTLSSSRARPYGLPYSEDAQSVLSDWSVDEDVHRLLYDEQDSYERFTVEGTEVSASVDRLVFAPSEAGASDYYEAIMAASDRDADLGFDYRDSVDISELERIAEVASVGSGSVLSVIDWDAVDKLIEDV